MASIQYPSKQVRNESPLPVLIDQDDNNLETDSLLPEINLSISESLIREEKTLSVFARLKSTLSMYVQRLPINMISIILALFTLLGHLTMTVILPVYSATFEDAGSDLYSAALVSAMWHPIVIFFMLFISRIFFDKSVSLKPAVGYKSLFAFALSGTTTGVFIVYASLPTRTPPYLQSILGSTLIPFTVLIRYIILRKGVSIRRGVCIVIAMIGLFITMEPRIWDLSGSRGNQIQVAPQSTTARILWPMCFLAAFVPDAINRVVTELELKKPGAQSLNLLAYGQLFEFFTYLLFFWTDFIPGFGAVDSFDGLLNRVATGMRCSVSSASCHGLAVKVWIMISGHVLGYIFHFLLIQHAEGAILASIVQSIRSPIAAIFWTLFKYNRGTDDVLWNPQFTMTTCFLIGGLIILVPAMLLYSYFSNSEIEKLKRKILRDRILDIQVKEGKSPFDRAAEVLKR